MLVVVDEENQWVGPQPVGLDFVDQPVARIYLPLAGEAQPDDCDDPWLYPPLPRLGLSVVLPVRLDG